MTGSALMIVVPIVVGIAVVLQVQFMGQMDRAMGTLESVFITDGVGGLLIGLLMLCHRGGNLVAARGLPWYVFSAGVLGLIIVGGMGLSAARVGLVATFTVVVTTQYIIGGFIDHFGLLDSTVHTLDASRITGIGMLLGGVWLILR